MPRGSRSSGGRSSFQRPAPKPQPRRAPPPRSQVPAPAPASAVGSPSTGKQPGLFANMASTAAGVAVGSTVGHTLGHVITGSMSDGQNEGAVNSQQTRDPQNPCEMEMKGFLECAQQQSDITLCQGFNEALKQCKMYYTVTENN